MASGLFERKLFALAQSLSLTIFRTFQHFIYAVAQLTEVAEVLLTTQKKWEQAKWLAGV